MEVRVLGPLTVMCDGQTVDITGAKERGLLVLLALQAGRVVSSERLVEELWEGTPPGSGVTALRVVVSRLRKALGDADGAVVTRSPGYLLDGASVEVDATRFEALVAKGRSHLDEGLADQAAAELRNAIALWHGERVAEAPGPLGRAEAARLEESRLGSVEARIGADLARGAHASLIGELEALTATHPLREGLWHARIVALYRCGRQAEALRTYQQLRVTLAEELGIDPSAELRRLEEAVLAQDPALDHRTASRVRNEDGLPTGVVTFLLTDIVDSTALWDDAPGAMERALEQHDDIVQTTVASHGGQLIKSKGEGDSSLSVFRRASSAATAATELQRRMTDAEWPAGLTLQVRAAIHTGEAQERDGDYYGSAVIRAARLRGLARGGQVLVSSATFELVQDALPDDLKLRSVGRRELRGLRRDEHVFELVLPWQLDAAAWRPEDEDLGRDLPPALATRLDSFFVGRDEHLARLVTHWAAVAGGHQRAVFVGGEPGIGKTRLAAELARHVADQGGRVVFGRCEEGIEAPYQPFIDVLRSLLEHGPLPDRRIVGDLVGMLPELAERCPQLPPPAGLGPEAERLALFDAAVNVLDHRAERRPLLVVIDDLQWGTEETCLMLRHALSHDGLRRVMIVATYRDTEVARASALATVLGDLPRLSGAERFVLTGLDDEGVRAYLWATGRNELADGGSALRARTGGNPFFLGAMLSAPLDGGGRPPDDVNDIVRRRVGALSRSAQKVLTVAAVVGERSELRVLERMPELGSSEDVLAALEEAVAAGLVRDEGGAFSFGHALIRDSILESLAMTRRIRLHRRVGETMEGLPDAGERLDALAHHFLEAGADGDGTKGAEYALRASSAALARLAPVSAIRYADRGVAMLEALSSRDMAALFDLLLARAKADHRELFGARTDGRDHFHDMDALLDLARDLEDAERFAAAVLRMGHVSFGPAGSPVSTRMGPLYIEADESLPPEAISLKAMLRARLAVHRSGIDAEGWSVAADAEDALARARQSGDPVAIAEALEAARRVLTGAPSMVRRLELCEESVAHARRSRLGVDLLGALYDRFVARLENGDRDLAEVDAASLLESGAPRVVLLVEIMRSMIDGRFADAEERLLRFASEGRMPTDDPTAQTMVAATLFTIARERGSLASLLPAIDAAIEEGGPPIYRSARAGALTEAGHVTAARACIDELLADDIAVVPHDGLYAAALCFMAEACASLDHAIGADLIRAQLGSYAGRLPSLNLTVTVVGAVDRYLGMLAVVLGDHGAAVEHFDAAIALEEGLRSPPLLARTRHWYGRALRDRSPERAVELLSASLATAEELGMEKLAADNRRLLGRAEPE